MTRVRPVERTDPLLDNPHKGCATFQRFAGDPTEPDEQWSEEGPLRFVPRPRPGAPPPPVATGYLPATISYCRWFWEVLEPRDGRLDWSMVRGALAAAAARGQTLQVRLMPFGSHGQPRLPGWYRRRYPVHRSVLQGRARPFPEPDYGGEAYRDRWGRVITEFGRLFDGHPALESVDLAYIGPWGEGAGEMPQERIESFTDCYARAHPRTPLLVNLDGPQFAAGLRRGCGWRCDCFGDLRTEGGIYVPGKTGWNHTFDAYPQAVAAAGATDIWKARPVTFESCATPLGWWRRGYDLDLIMQQGEKFHVSVFMPKSCPIPVPWLDPLARFCDRIGYRFVMRQAAWADGPVRRADGFRPACWIENTGVAPVAWPYRLAFRLRRGRRTLVLVSEADARGWLPGDAIVEDRLAIPRTLPAGRYDLAAGLVVPGETVSKVSFANRGVGADRWLALGEVRVA